MHVVRKTKAFCCFCSFLEFSMEPYIFPTKWKTKAFCMLCTICYVFLVVIFFSGSDRKYRDPHLWGNPCSPQRCFEKWYPNDPKRIKLVPKWSKLSQNDPKWQQLMKKEKRFFRANVCMSVGRNLMIIKLHECCSEFIQSSSAAVPNRRSSYLPYILPTVLPTNPTSYLPYILHPLPPTYPTSYLHSNLPTLPPTYPSAYPSYLLPILPPTYPTSYISRIKNHRK